MTIPVYRIISVGLATAAISGCFFLQGPLLGAPSGSDPLAARHNDAGVQAYKQEKWDGAREEFEAATKVTPSLAEAHYNLGMVLYRQGKDAEAKPHFLKAAALAPDNDVILNAPPFVKVEAPYRPTGSAGMSDGHSHSH